MTSYLTAVIALGILTSCGSASPAPNAPSPAQSTFGVAPAIADMCTHVDANLLNTILGTAGVHGEMIHRPPVGLSGLLNRTCIFRLPHGTEVDISIGPVPMLTTMPGAAVALDTLINENDYPHDRTVNGVGDLAIYQPLTDVSLRLDAVHGRDLHWYGVDIAGYDDTPGHTVLGKITEDQLAQLARECLTGL